MNDAGRLKMQGEFRLNLIQLLSLKETVSFKKIKTAFYSVNWQHRTFSCVQNVFRMRIPHLICIF